MARKRELTSVAWRSESPTWPFEFDDRRHRGRIQDQRGNAGEASCFLGRVLVLLPVGVGYRRLVVGVPADGPRRME